MALARARVEPSQLRARRRQQQNTCPKTGDTAGDFCGWRHKWRAADGQGYCAVGADPCSNLPRVRAPRTPSRRAHPVRRATLLEGAREARAARARGDPLRLNFNWFLANVMVKSLVDDVNIDVAAHRKIHGDQWRRNCVLLPA